MNTLAAVVPRVVVVFESEPPTELSSPPALATTLSTSRHHCQAWRRARFSSGTT